MADLWWIENGNERERGRTWIRSPEVLNVADVAAPSSSPFLFSYGFLSYGFLAMTVVERETNGDDGGGERDTTCV